MKYTYSLFLTAFVLLVSTLPLAAQKFQPQSIQFKGDPEYSDQELMQAAGLKKGAILTNAEMNEHSKKLMDSGVFDGLAFKFDGQDLIFQLTPAAQMFPIRLEKMPFPAGPELDNKLHSRFPLYHGKVPAEGTLLSDVRGALEQMLVEQGIHATVTATPYGAKGERKVSAMTFSILSPAVRVGAIRLVGVSPQWESKVRKVAERAAKTAFDSRTAESNLEAALASFYADEGYAAARIHAVRAGDPQVTPEAIDLPFTISIEEGMQYKLGAIRLHPNEFVSQIELDKMLSPNADLQSNQHALGNARFLLTSRCKSKGYLDCQVIPHPEFDESMRMVNYDMEIVPGSVYRLAFVKFENVSDDLRARLMRIWQMLPGEAFDDSYVSNFILRAQKEDPALQRTLAAVKVNYDVLADPVTHEVNCVIRLERASAQP
jgi:outer membrane protein insertion porin family